MAERLQCCPGSFLGGLDTDIFSDCAKHPDLRYQSALGIHPIDFCSQRLSFYLLLNLEINNVPHRIIG